MSTLTRTPAPASAPRRPARVAGGAFSWSQVRASTPGALRKLDPRQQWHNPVMFIVWVGAVLTTALAIAEPFLGGPGSSGGTPVPATFTWAIAIWLWLTVLFANLAEAVAESRGKAQADSLRKTRTSTLAHRLTRYDEANDPCRTANCLDYFGHVYTTTGTMTVTLQVSWNASYSLDGTDFQPVGDAPITGPASTVRVQVRQARGVLVLPPGD